jgi:hypothetical protein
MAIVLISVAAFTAAILTFFSGFGLGTLFTPLFMLFFPALPVPTSATSC